MADNLDFLERIDDSELRQEIRAVLTQLQLLSEARAIPLGRSAPTSEKPTGPPGFEGLSETDEPDIDRSLYEHFIWCFRSLVHQRAARKELWYLLKEAEHELRRRTVPPTPDELLERRALESHRPSQSPKEEEAFAASIVKDFEGVHTFEVHLKLKLPMGWIEKIREQHNRDPVMGEPREPWRKLTADRKRELVAEKAYKGLTQPEAAKVLGCGERTVRDYWPSRVAA